MVLLKWIFIFFVFTVLLFLIASCAINRHIVEFKNQACLTPARNYEYYTCDELHVLIDNEKEISVYKGFITNLSSIPRLFWWLYAPQYTNFVSPAIVHDYMYSMKGFWDRKYADDVFYSCLKANGVSEFTSLLFWISVRLFGGKHYLRNYHGR